MEPYAAAPVRPLSADQWAALRAFYKPQLPTLLVAGLFAPLIFGMIAGVAFALLGHEMNTDGIISVGLSVGVVAIILMQLILRWTARRKTTRAAFIYQHGQAETVTFAGLTSAHYRKDRQPETVINLLRGTEPLKIKTFDERIIAAFMRPQQVVYVHPKYPDVLVPSSLFAFDPSTGQGLTPRIVKV